MINERKLSKPEANKREDIVMGMKKNKSSLVKKYGKEAERVMYGSATKKAKELAETKENKLKKMIEDALMKGISEKKAKKDYDGDGKIESSSEEYKGSRDRAIKKTMGKELKEDWGGSDEGALLNSMHKDLGNPSSPPSIIKVYNASESANDFYRGDEEDYNDFRESNIRRSAQKYYLKYFPDFYEGMKKLFSESLNEDWIADQAKVYWLEKFKKGLIDKLPDDPKEAFLAQ